ncbi:DEAD/DEAH box helicase [Thermus brockianus]
MNDWEFVPVETLDDFVRKHRLQGKEHYAEVLFLKEVYLPLFGSEGLALLLPQVGFLDEEGGERRADFILFGQRPYAIEIEGKSYHERPDRFAREKSRQRSLTLRGVAYFPIAYDDIRSGKAREALIRLAESDPVLGGYLRKGGVGLSRGPAYSPLHWLVDFPVRYPIALKGAFARLLKAVREGERSVQIVDPESSTPLVEAAFADAYFTLLNVGRLAGVDLPLPEVRVYRLDADSVSRTFRDLLPLWVGRIEGFSVVDGVPEEGALDVFSWDRIASLAREADAFQAEYEEERGSWTPPFVGAVSSALVLDFFARKFFPVPELKEAQLRLLQRALRGESGLALLPTGYGKSLIFQLYSFLVPGVNIVISPLRALMRDQVYNLQRIGVTAVTSISSDDEAAAKESKTKTLLEGRYRLVYLSPERIRIKGFVDSKLAPPAYPA